MKTKSSLALVVIALLTIAACSAVYVAVNRMSGEHGFTQVVQSPDTRMIFVSASQGSDGNSGRTPDEPVKTLDQAFSLTRAKHPDHVLLKRGDVWIGESLNGVKSGRSADEPFVVGFYGAEGARPQLKNDGKFLIGDPRQHVRFIGLHLVAYRLDPEDPAFTGEARHQAPVVMLGNFEDILFEDMKFQHVRLVLQEWRKGRPTDIVFRRSIFTEVYSNQSSYKSSDRSTHIYAEGTDGLILEQNVFDYGGWSPRVAGAGANMYSHNIYIQHTTLGNAVIVRNNIIVRGASHGIHGRPGGLYENNFFARNAVSLQMGYSGGATLDAGRAAYAFDNVITEGVGMRRGIDACEGHNLCTPALWGLVLDNIDGGDVRVEDNIIANRDFSDKGKVTGLAEDPGAEYDDNIVYRWNNPAEGSDRNYPDPDRTLATYNAFLGGEKDFDAFMEVVKNRPPQVWDERYTADAINDYIRDGFGR